MENLCDNSPVNILQMHTFKTFISIELWWLFVLKKMIVIKQIPVTAVILLQFV